MLGNRELASLIIIGALVLFMCARASGRQSVWAVIKSFFAAKLVMIWLLLAGVVVGVTWGLHALGLNYSGSTRDAVVWACITGLALLFKASKLGREPGLMREALIDTIRLTTFVEFFVNVYVFPLWGELTLQVAVLFVVMLGAVAETDEKFRVIQKGTDRLLQLVGGVILVIVAVKVASEPSKYFTRDTGLALFQPAILSPFVVALTYAVGLLMAYELAFMRVGFNLFPDRQKRRAKLALVVVLKARIGKVSRLTLPTLHRIAEQESWREARAQVERYRFAEDAEKAASSM